MLPLIYEIDKIRVCNFIFKVHIKNSKIIKKEFKQCGIKIIKELKPRAGWVGIE